MKRNSDESSFINELTIKKYKDLYKEIETKGIEFFEPQFELYYLSMAYNMMIYFMNEEKYMECSVIKEAIDYFMIMQPGALEVSIRKMKKHQDEIFGNKPNGSNY